MVLKYKPSLCDLFIFLEKIHQYKYTYVNNNVFTQLCIYIYIQFFVKEEETNLLHKFNTQYATEDIMQKK